MVVKLNKRNGVIKMHRVVNNAPCLPNSRQASPEKGGFALSAPASVTVRNHSGKAVDTWLEYLCSGRVRRFSNLFLVFRFLKSTYI